MEKSCIIQILNKKVFTDKALQSNRNNCDFIRHAHLNGVHRPAGKTKSTNIQWSIEGFGGFGLRP